MKKCIFCLSTSDKITDMAIHFTIKKCFFVVLASVIDLFNSRRVEK